ncbi:MAG: PIG-L family deacetylase [Bacteroidota bacterium]|nr:PIG-L family deacetylase [Bacteroidota bacterium]
MTRSIWSIGVWAVLGLVGPGAAYAQEARYVVMNLAGHPDDEDGATMHYYRHARDVEVHSVIFTRGEGGQNEIGPELYEALGAIRTRETEDAARRLGTQVHYLNFYDFGFSKEADETFDVWGGRDHVTATLVELIRSIKPDVIFTNHDTVTVGPSRQHGHHQAVGLAAWDAFERAADPEYHPDQLSREGVDLWQPKRLFQRYWSRSDTFDAVVPIGELKSAEGISYAQAAAEALHFHASQGMGQFAVRLARRDAHYFHLLRGVGVPTSGDLLAGLTPEKRPTPTLDYLIDSGRIAPGSRPQVDDRLAVPGQSVTLTWPAVAVDGASGRLSGIIDTTIVLSSLGPTSINLRIPLDATPTRPAKVYQYRRTLSSPPLRYAVLSGGTLLSGGYVDLEVAPPVHIEPVTETLRLRSGHNVLRVTGKAYDSGLDSIGVSISVEAGETTSKSAKLVHTRVSVDDLAAGASLPITMPVNAPMGNYDIRIAINEDRAPLEFIVQGRLFEAEAAPNLSVGVVTSYDDTLPTTLDDLGVDYVMLDSTALARGAFEGLHTIVLDIRAYLIRSDLRHYNDNLLMWVEAGGHLVVNYHKTMEWNPREGRPSWAPYPIELGRDRVTRETAPVSVRHPTFMNYPNQISSEAWDGWVQERGLYFPARWDDSYEEIFCMNDPGEAEHCGSTLLAQYGNGTYLYTALVWYRQLKANHPGAYRLFANMISLPLNPAAH